MKFFTRRRIFLGILIIILPIFYISNPTINDYDNYSQQKFMNEEILENLSDSLNSIKDENIPEICSKIEGIIAINNQTIEIRLKNTVDSYNLFNFVFETEYLNEILLFDYNSFKNISYNQNTKTISFDIILPFITEYEGTMHCISNEFHKVLYRKIDDFKKRKKYYSSPKIIISKDDFSQLSVSYNYIKEKNEYIESEMKCYGESFDDRFCYGKNIFLIHDSFVFYSNAIYQFPSNFVLLAPRNNTNQTFTDRLSHSPIVTSKVKLSKAESMKLVVKENYVYIHSYYEEFLQNVLYLYEFLFPTYQTIQIIEESPIASFDREFYAMNRNEYYNNYYKIFSNHPVQDIYKLKHKKMLFSNVIFGMKRKWKQVDSEPYYYNYTKDDIKGLRELGYSRFNISIGNLTNTALFALSEHRFNNFGNFQTFPNDVKSECPAFNVKTVQFFNSHPTSTISLVSSSSLLIGQHSTSLASVFWMKEGATLVELVPRGFDCCNWYKDLASFSGANYHRVIDSNDNLYFNKIVEHQKMLHECYNDPNRCQRKDCYKILRKQMFVVWTDEWKSIISNICPMD